MKNVVITGTSLGLGHHIALRFLEDPEYLVHGVDVLPATVEHKNYIHYEADVSVPKSLPDINDVSILINNAGIQTEGNDETCVHDIEVNLIGTINCVHKYVTKDIKSIVNLCSVCAHTGADFPYYVASKGGVLSYTKNLAIEVAKYGATCNSLSFGGSFTEMNKHILQNKELLSAVYNETLLKKWSELDELAEWVYFIAVVNKSMTGQDVVVDNGECANFHFVW